MLEADPGTSTETQESGNPVTNAPLVTMLSKGDLEQPALDLSIRAARSRPRRAKSDSKERRDAPPERPVVPPTENKSANSDTDIDPLDTHCSDELKLAQDTDSNIKQMKKCLSAKPLRKPTPKEISHHGPKFKALWSKWGALNVIEDVLYLKWTTP